MMTTVRGSSCILVAVGLLAGCIRSNTVECEGLTCAEDRVCDTVHHACILPAQNAE